MRQSLPFTNRSLTFEEGENLDELSLEEKQVDKTNQFSKLNSFDLEKQSLESKMTSFAINEEFTNNDISNVEEVT
jgi:hypothetical protein